ncbi:colanic acid/amylovoran biosynthesis glycosyltransferase [Flavobacterium arsenatis]|uniref:Colanic acid/amylovoran biosynthesis glycosyltransferase n=1 Tax=Flavobacterium arsenatis TaxID=1484332 RepID=A0ABU1TM21_9FLAO|nr:glycosyltransferase family 4 protein [Flavobacterium arsenatis]MDR6966996.1 colanic acid/amylovoran biosynthesis glycosyltransferase [Flavobacterium arsenatis]
MSKKIKIAVYSGEVPSTTFIERLINGLSDEGYTILLFGYLKKRTRYSSSSISVTTYSDNRIQKLFHLIKYSLLLGLFKREEKKQLDVIIAAKSKNKTLSKIKYYPVLWHKPEVFHLQWARSIEDWIWVQNFGIKLVVSLRGAHINYTPITHPEIALLYQKTFPKVDGFHAVSKAIGKEAEKYGASSAKIQVVYSGLNKIIVPGKSNEDKTFTIISVGRTHWKKGYNYALETCKILKDSGFKFNYQIVGANDSEELTYLVNTLNLQEEVLLSGKMPFFKVQESMRNADVLLLPSLEEGIANVVLEAMQLGTLVISTDCGGMDEVIENGQNGFIVPTRNPQQMSDSILKIAQLPHEEKQSMMEQAKITIEQQHTTEKMISDMISLYQKVIAS